MVYDIRQIEATLDPSSPQYVRPSEMHNDLHYLGIDYFNPAIDVHADFQLPPSVVYSPFLTDKIAPPFVTLDPSKAPIGTGGIPHGMAIQSSPVLVQASGDFGDVIQVNLVNDLNAALATTGNYKNFHLLLSSFTNGQVAITPGMPLATADNAEAKNVVES